jgi:hypothetical protein
MDPELGDLEPDLEPGTLAWTIYCADEDMSVGDDDLTQDDAETGASAHAADTGHTASAVLSLLGSGENSAGGDMLSVAFCITYSGRPWHTIILAAPSPDDGLTTLQQLINRLNAVAVAKGFEPLFAATLGACPAS